MLHMYVRVDDVERGSEAVLRCRYTLTPGEYVDSVKWFLNTTEIYRIVPALTKHRLTLREHRNIGLNILVHCSIESDFQTTKN